MATTIECHQLHEIDTHPARVNVPVFTANNEYLVGGTTRDVRVWRVKDGKQVAALKVNGEVYSVAASRDGRYIAAGSTSGDVLVWDATTYKRVFSSQTGCEIHVVDFSVDSTRLVSADSSHNTATIWDIATGRKLQTLSHDGPVRIAKYSPQGDRIATATLESVRIWDSHDGRLLFNIKVQVKGWRNLLWYKNYLFVNTRASTIKQINASTGSIVSEWSVPDARRTSMALLLQHGEFIAHSSHKTITLWDPVTRTRLGLISHTDDIFSFAFSSDGSLVSITPEKSRTVIKQLFQSISEPELDIDSSALDAWRHGHLTNAEALLSAAISMSKNTAHHALASRALVRARLGQLDAALVDAKESLKVQRSLLGYIAKCIALVGMGEKDEGIWVCDIALQHFHSKHVTLFLLIKIVVLFVAGEHVNAISRMGDLIADGGNMYPALYVVLAYMHLLLGNIYLKNNDYQRAIQSFEEARTKLGSWSGKPPLIVSLISGWEFDDLTITIQQHLCEALFSAGRTEEAAECVLDMVDQEINLTEPIQTWVSGELTFGWCLQQLRRGRDHPLSGFKSRCRGKLEDLGDGALNARQYDEAILHYTTALSLKPAMPQDLLVKRSNAWAGNGAWKDALDDAKEWASLILASGTWKDALVAAGDFLLERLTVYQVVCERLEMTGRVIDTVACLHQISDEQEQEMGREQVSWVRDFKTRCRRRLEGLGDSAVDAKKYDEAVSHYTAALSLDPISPQDLLVKQSKAYAEAGKWEEALNDANEVIKLDSSSPSGYERKYAALLGMRHRDAMDTFEIMLSKMSESSDPEIRERSRRYVSPEQTKRAIRKSIQNAIHDSPMMLINTVSGRLCNKSEQAAAFESTPAFIRLITSITTHIDLALIDQAVGEFYRYATFSHTWEGNEPLYEEVIKIVVYNLKASPTHEKLRMFCKIVRDEGFNWAWSDTCCINQGDHFVLQEALVSMFRWYEGSAMTIIFLCDVDRLAEIGALIGSRWNSRGWTLQEYHASKVVRIYTKDWTPYLGLTIHNHKDSPEIISEMEQATEISAQALMALRPGLNDIREKLRLASTRQTTRVEDAAYSLLGIFSMSLPITYGEGDRALGRLLSQLLMSSGDTSILAWSGKSGSFNSCLPANISVFNSPLTSHIPPTILTAEIGAITSGLHAPPLDLNLVTRLYDQLGGLRTPTFAGQRMRLPCLIFDVEALSPFQNGAEFVFRAQAGALGAVEIKTRQNLTQLESMYLVHPWIDFLLDRRAGKMVEIEHYDETSEMDHLTLLSASSSTTSPVTPTRAARIAGRLSRALSGRSNPDATSLSPEKRTRILQFAARLRQQFGALLLTPTRQKGAEYRRIATESLITVQVEEITPATLEELIRSVRVLDVL